MTQSHHVPHRAALVRVLVPMFSTARDAHVQAAHGRESRRLAITHAWVAMDAQVGHLSGATGAGSLPVLRLIYVPAWALALGRDARCYLQGRDRRLFLRVQGVAPRPALETLLILDARGNTLRRGDLHPLPPGSGAFALRHLNGEGRPEEGRSWWVRGIEPQDVMGVTPSCMDLVGGSTLGRLGVFRYRPAPPRPVAQLRRFIDLAGAYERGDPDGFRRSLLEFVTRKTRGGRRHRTLSQMENLWLSAFVAEIRQVAGRRARDFGCSDLFGYPFAIQNATAV